MVRHRTIIIANRKHITCKNKYIVIAASREIVASDQEFAFADENVVWIVLWFNLPSGVPNYMSMYGTKALAFLFSNYNRGGW